MTAKDWSQVPGALVTHDEAAVSPLTTALPLYTVRTRLEARGLWGAMVQALMSNPEKLLRLLSAQQTGMVDTTDADTIDAIRAIGGDPAEILR